MKNLLILLLFVSIVANTVMGLRLWLHKCDCPDVQYVNAFSEADTLSPETVIPIFNSNFDTLFSDTYTPPTPRKKPRLTDRVTGRHNYHKVKKGENLYRIGLKYGVPYDFLMEVNNKKSVRVQAGSWIYIGTEEERKRWLAANTKVDADSLYIYNKRYGDSLNYADVYTESYGPLRKQAVDFHYTTPKNLKFGLGLGVSTNPVAPFKAKGGYLKDGTMYTLDVGIGKQPTVGVGIIKMIK